MRSTMKKKEKRKLQKENSKRAKDPNDVLLGFLLNNR